MERLNQKATKIFEQLLTKLLDKAYFKIVNDPFMPLSMERLNDGFPTPWGNTQQYSLCHYYEQNGDLMHDPEVCFLVADKQDSDQLCKVFPFTFYQANVGIYQEPVSFMDGKIYRYDQRTQADITAFANQWLRNIQDQGFLKF